MSDGPELAEVLTRLERLENVESARNLHHVYAETLDEPDARTVAALFTEDAVLRTPAGSFRGRAAIQDFFGGAFEADTSLKQHFIVNPKIVDADGRRVRVQSYFIYLGRGDDASILGWGTYDDLIDVSGPEPLFAEKEIAVIVGTTLAAGWAKETTA